MIIICGGSGTFAVYSRNISIQYCITISISFSLFTRYKTQQQSQSHEKKAIKRPTRIIYCRRLEKYEKVRVWILLEIGLVAGDVMCIINFSTKFSHSSSMCTAQKTTKEMLFWHDSATPPLL